MMGACREFLEKLKAASTVFGCSIEDAADRLDATIVLKDYLDRHKAVGEAVKTLAAIPKAPPVKGPSEPQ